MDHDPRRPGFARLPYQAARPLSAPPNPICRSSKQQENTVCPPNQRLLPRGFRPPQPQRRPPRRGPAVRNRRARGGAPLVGPSPLAGTGRGTGAAHRDTSLVFGAGGCGGGLWPGALRPAPRHDTGGLSKPASARANRCCVQPTEFSTTARGRSQCTRCASMLARSR